MSATSPFDIIADLDTPVSAFLKLHKLQPRFLLESVEGAERLARYSFLGFGDVVKVHYDHDGLYVDEALVGQPENKEQYLDYLRQFLRTSPELKPKIDELPFSGGLVGVSGYDIIRLFEELPCKSIPQENLPKAIFVMPTSVLVFDHLTRRVALLHAGSEPERVRLKDEVVKTLRGSLPKNANAVKFEEPHAGMSEAEFVKRVAKCKEWIDSGDIYQVVLSVIFKGQSKVDSFEVYRALRLLNPSPYMFYFDFGALRVAGSSPEALVKLDGNRASLRPIAGTMPRGSTRIEDQRNEKLLLEDPKESAEHVMLVDLARNDLGRVAKENSIEVNPFRVIERYSHVMHIVSGVKGELAKGQDAFDLFAASFPAGTLVGAPKIRAMEIIEEMEMEGRGLYGGTAGYFDVNGDMDQAITIRTIVFNEDEYSFQAGAGIVKDSIPENEYREVFAKSAILKKALAMAGEGL
jgi:anthranilate synthase component I